jgi:hypothetical protein
MKRAQTTRLTTAFTLVEVLVAMTLCGLIMMSIVSSVRTLSGVKDRMERRKARLQEARHALQTIVGALRNVRRDSVAPDHAIIGKSGGRGAGNDRINLLVVDDRRSRPDGAESDQYETGFYLSKPPGRPWPVLLCRKDHALDDFFEEGGMATVVAEGITGLTFEYFTGMKWQNDWSDLEPKAPSAVRVTVAAVDSDMRNPGRRPDTVLLSTIVSLHAIEPRDAQPAENPQAGRNPR